MLEGVRSVINDAHSHVPNSGYMASGHRLGVRLIRWMFHRPEERYSHPLRGR